MPGSTGQAHRDFDLRRIDLNLLLIFEAIYSARNISQAAKGLGMSQPTVSNALARLRQQFDDQLFVRSDRGVAPTGFANFLIKPVRDALATLRGGLESIGTFDLAQANRTFILAIHDFALPAFLPPLLREIDAEAPNVRIEIAQPDWDSPYEALMSGKVDFSLDIFPHQQQGVTFEPFPPIDVVCIARRGHPFVDGSVTREQFSRAGHVVMPLSARLRMQTANIFLAAGIARRVVCEVPNGNDMAPMVAATDLLAIVPRRYANTVAPGFGLQVMPLPFEYPLVRIFMGWKTDKSADPGLNWLKTHFLRVANSDPGGPGLPAQPAEGATASERPAR